MRARYNPPQQMMLRPRLVLVCAARLCVLALSLVPVAYGASWSEPASALARQIAALSGPGAAKLVVNNHSTLPGGEVPVIRQLLESDLRGLGVGVGGSDSATLIRVTLSENLQGGLWVAEVVEGTETRVTMLAVRLDAPPPASAGPTLTLRGTLEIAEPEPVLDAGLFPVPGEQRLVVLEADRIAVYTKPAGSLTAPGPVAASWAVAQTIAIHPSRPFPRDVRGRLAGAQDHLFGAWLPGVECSGANDGAQLAVSCEDSDDPWPLTSTQRGFYSAMRNYFTGILTPGYGMELAPFYAAAEIPRPTGAALLLNEVNGNVVLLENGAAAVVHGAGDWGSDLAVVRSGCGSGAQVLVTGSGAATNGDSLRAWEIAGREAIPVSAPMPVDGTITAIGTAPDGTTADMVVRRESPERYEVWNVAALCN
jgi:hypothetical protein